MAFVNTLKRKLAAGEHTRGFWVSLESPSITEIAVELGFDWIVIDTEHGHLDFKEVVDHLRVLRGTDVTPIVRVQECQQGLIKRMLDLGAQGIIVPQVMGPEDVEQAVKYAKYPPWGVRGVGGERAVHWGMQLAEYTSVANDETMVIPLIETVAAGDSIDAIMDIPGVDALFFGPVDYSASAGVLGTWGNEEIEQRILAIHQKIVARGFPTGLLAMSPEIAVKRKAQGFRMLAHGCDTGLLIHAAKQMLEATKS